MKKLVQKMVDCMVQFQEGLVTEDEYVRFCLDMLFVHFLNIKTAAEMNATIEVLGKLDPITQ